MSDANIRTLPATKSDKLNLTPEQIVEYLKTLPSAEQAKVIKQGQEIKKLTVEKEQANKVSKPRGTGVQSIIEKLVFEQPKLTDAAFYAELKKRGCKSTSKTSIDSYRSLFLHSLRTLKELGALTSSAAAKVQ